MSHRPSLLGALLTSLVLSACASSGTPDDAAADIAATDGGTDAPRRDARPEAGSDVVIDVTPVCGNGAREAAEQCDDGNSVDGDGCDVDCTLSCDADRDCDDGVSCNGAETCEAATHRCLPGVRSADGTACAPGRVCRAGACVVGPCGDGVVTAPDEQCDDGNAVDGDGCDASCRFSCARDADCDDGNPCNGAERCALDRHACAPGARPADGALCGPARTCRAGACAPLTCGNRVVEPGEQCDDGNAVDGDGCDTDCAFTCATDADCADGNACNGAEVCDRAAHRCGPGAAPAEGAACDNDGDAATREVCRAGACRRSSCGDGYVDGARGETCEPPTPGCDPTMCRTSADAVCGNGALEPGEQCDDGNRARWDGCDGTCRVEQTVRLDSFEQLPGPIGCDLDGDGRADNAFGRAFTDLAREQYNMRLREAIASGDANILIHFMDLDDRIGRNDPAVRVAFLGGDDAVAPFEGQRDEAFVLPPEVLDAMREPRLILAPGAIRSTRLEAGPGTLAFGTDPTGMGSGMRLHRAYALGSVVADTAHNRIDGLANGRACGALSAADLDRIILPSEGPPPDCVAMPPRRSSLLDFMVRGCRLGSIPVVNPTQPDIDLDGDGVFAGGVSLEDTDGDRVVDTCRDGRTGTVITGDDCAQDPRFDDAYSTAMGMSGYRVTVTGVR